MELKSIEMQIALPRTQDAGRLQDQLQNRGQLQQDQINQSVQKDVEKLQNSVVKEERKDTVRLHQEEEGREEYKGQKRDKKKQKGKNKNLKEKHPYKGRRIDYCG